MSVTTSSWISKKPERCGGRACVRDTRITVWGLVARRRSGLSDAAILEALHELTARALELVEDWEASFGPYAPHLASTPDAARLDEAWTEFGERMRGNLPFFHPRYAGQMLKPPHPVAVAGYLAGMLVNTKGGVK